MGPPKRARVATGVARGSCYFSVPGVPVFGGLPSSTRPSLRRSRPSCARSEEHTSELQSLMRISYAVFCLKKKNNHPYISSYNYRIESLSIRSINTSQQISQHKNNNNTIQAK